MELENIIRKFAQDNNIIAGICDAKRLDYLEGTDLTAPFVRYNKEERIDPALSMPSAKSLIVIGVGYRKKPVFEPDSAPRGVFSVGAVGSDYHGTIEHILNELATALALSQAIESRIFVDTGPLIEREIAKKAGIAWQGKSGNLISERFGTFFNIGYMLVDAKLTPSASFVHDASFCGNCQNCINACPARALTGKGVIAQRCVSYLTQTKEPLAEDQMRAMGNRLYGCDVCQQACPQNAGKYADGTIDEIDRAQPKITDILKLTNREFKKKYGATSIGWRGLSVIKRNALIACVNSGDSGLLAEFDLAGIRDHPVLGCAVAYYQKNRSN